MSNNNQSIIKKNTDKILYIFISVTSFYLIKSFNIFNFYKKNKVSKKNFLKWWSIENLANNNIYWFKELKYFKKWNNYYGIK